MPLANSNYGSQMFTASSHTAAFHGSRISWGAVVAGAVVAVASILLLNLLGAAFGFGSIQALDSTSSGLRILGTGAAIWELVALALAMAFGGYVTARLSGTHSHLDGELHGITMWGLAVLLGSILLAQAIGSTGGFLAQGAAAGMNRITDTVGTTTTGFGDASGTLTGRLQQSLASSGDATSMTRRQTGAEISALVGKSVAGDASAADISRLTYLVAAQAGITQEEATRRVDRMVDEAKANLTLVQQKARSAAETAAYAAATAARILFTALVLGLLGALVGAWIGTRHKRILHPVAAQMPRDTTEVVRPISMSTYDESGHLITR